MLGRIFSVGLLAGLIAGVPVALLQGVTTTPLILAAEVYEAGGPVEGHSPAAGHDHAVGDQEEIEAWMPADGIERALSTAITTVATAVGFALMLIAAMVLAGDAVTPARGLMWAAAGFLATGLAPALGLAPELPGTAAADLVLRQIWWIATAAATAGGLWLMLRTPGPVAKLSGLALLVAPHAIGAPQPESHTSAVPAEFAADFAASALVVHAVLWLVLGGAIGLIWQRLDRQVTAAT